MAAQNRQINALKSILKKTRPIPQPIHDLRKEKEAYTVELPMIPLLLVCDDAPGMGILTVVRRPISELPVDITRALPSIVQLRHQFSSDWSESPAMDTDSESDYESDTNDNELFDKNDNTTPQKRHLSTPPTEQGSLTTNPDPISIASTQLQKPKKTVKWEETTSFNEKPNLTSQKSNYFQKLNPLKAVSLPLDINDFPPELRNEIEILLADSPTSTRLEDLFVHVEVGDEESFWRKKRRCDKEVKVQRLARNSEGCFEDEEDEEEDRTFGGEGSGIGGLGEGEGDSESESEGFGGMRTLVGEGEEEDDFGIVFEGDCEEEEGVSCP